MDLQLNNQTSQPTKDQTSKTRRASRSPILNAIVGLFIILGVAVGVFFYLRIILQQEPQDEQSCQQAGGQWIYTWCNQKMKDAGKECTDGSQCKSNICVAQLTEEQKQQLWSGSAIEGTLKANELTGIKGECYSYETPLGCLHEVQKGTVSGMATCYQ